MCQSESCVLEGPGPCSAYSPSLRILTALEILTAKAILLIPPAASFCRVIKQSKELLSDLTRQKIFYLWINVCSRSMYKVGTTKRTQPQQVHMTLVK